MRVLVMGGSYFIGKKIVDILLINGYDVTILNRGSRKNENSKINQIISDRNDADRMKEILTYESFDYVVDLGLDKKSLEILCEALDTKNLKKFIFISSSAVYDLDNLEIPFKETDKICENSIWTSYGKNKIEAENYLKSYFEDTNTSVIALRPPYVYGENNYAQRESFIFDHILMDKAVILPGNGDTKIQFIYTTDLANIIVACMEKETDKFMALNVGNKQSITMKEWVLKCSKMVGNPVEIVYFDYKKYNKKERDFFPFYDYSNVLDVTEVNKLYNHETDFTHGLLVSYKWYLKNKNKINFKENIKENEKNILKMLSN